MKEVCSPLVTDCSLNILYVLLAIKLATTSDNGVITMTTSVILTLIVNINKSVPNIVITPVNSCVNPISKPSLNWSTSATILLTMSPYEFESIYFSGKF